MEVTESCFSAADCQWLSGPVDCLDSRCTCLEGFLLSDFNCLLDPGLGSFTESVVSSFYGPFALDNISADSELSCETYCQYDTPNCLGFRFNDGTCTLYGANSLSAPHGANSFSAMHKKSLGVPQGAKPFPVPLDSTHPITKILSGDFGATNKVFGFHRAAGDPRQQDPEQLWQETPDGRRFTLLSDRLRDAKGNLERCRQLDAVLYAPRSADDLSEVLDALDVSAANLPPAELYTKDHLEVQEWAGILLGITKLNRGPHPEFISTTDYEFELGGFDEYDADLTAPSSTTGHRIFIRVGQDHRLSLTRSKSLLSGICQYLGRDISRGRNWRSHLGWNQTLTLELHATYQVQAVRYTMLTNLYEHVTVTVWVRTPAGGEVLCGRRSSETPRIVDTVHSCPQVVYGRAVSVVAALPDAELTRNVIAQWPAVFGNQLSQE